MRCKICGEIIEDNLKICPVCSNDLTVKKIKLKEELKVKDK